MFYKNVSLTTKTFHGVEFKPGEIKEVNKYINANCMVVVPEPAQPKVEKKREPVVEKAPEVVEDAPIESAKKPNNKEEKLDGTDNN